MLLTSIAGHRLSLYALYWVLFVVQPQVYRVSFLLMALVLTFLLVPGRRRRSRSHRAGRLGARRLAIVVALAWPLADFHRFIYRAADPLPIDVVLGAIEVLLVLEATRRSVGWILPVTAAGVPGLRGRGPLVRSTSALRCSRTAAIRSIG